MYMSVNSYQIRTGRYNILLDTCGGNHKERPHSLACHQKGTSGHLGINASSNGNKALFSGDCLHYPSQII